MTDRIYKYQSHLVRRNSIVGGMYNTGTIQPGTPIEWAFFVNAFASGAYFMLPPLMLIILRLLL